MHYNSADISFEKWDYKIKKPSLEEIGVVEKEIEDDDSLSEIETDPHKWQISSDPHKWQISSDEDDSLSRASEQSSWLGLRQPLSEINQQPSLMAEPLARKVHKAIKKEIKKAIKKEKVANIFSEY